MNYMTELVEDDLKYICYEIPYKDAADYFRRYPEEFTKLRPGFRVKSLREDEVAKILFDFRNRNFISSFIEKCITKWLKEISEVIEEAELNGLNEEECYIYVLSRSVFANNVSLYFKINKLNKSEEYLLLLNSAVNQQLKIIEENENLRNKYKRDLSEKEKLLEKSKIEVEQCTRKHEKLHGQFLKIKSEEETYAEEIAKKEETISNLKSDITYLKKENIDLSEHNNEITASYMAKQDFLSKQIRELEKQIDGYETQISTLKESNVLLKKAEEEAKDRELLIIEMQETIETLNCCKNDYEEKLSELEKSLEEMRNSNRDADDIMGNGSRTVANRERILPQRPTDIDDFEEYFNYNLNNIGFDETFDAYSLFVKYIEKIAFSGMPLLMKHGPGINIANCLANTLYGQQTAAILTFIEKAGTQEIREFLTYTSDRVICLDGFIGNCNEIELLPLLEQYRDRIIILTYMYDRTLNYLPMEILSYVHYINVDEFPPLLNIKDISEDPSEIQEEPFLIRREVPEDNRLKKIFREIAEQCGICKDVTNSMSDLIEEEDYMNSLLIFSLLPYVAKVMREDPFNRSKRLQKYAGESGKCLQKNIVLRWFG